MVISAKAMRRKILPILLYCQAQKGDLSIYGKWKGHRYTGKKLFYAYYAGLFSRILCILETDSSIISEYQKLLDKYNWYNITQPDIDLFKAAGPNGCEVPAAQEYIPGVDDVWNAPGFPYGRDAICIKFPHSSWSFADVRGSV